MNRFFKGLMGATALLGVSMTTAHAQDYVWTFDLGFYANETFGAGWNPTSFFPAETSHEDNNAGASGTITVTKTGPTSYEITSFLINTTAGSGVGGIDPTLFQTVYDSDVSSGFTGDFLNTSYTFFSDGDNVLTLVWETGALVAAMNSNIQGSTVDMNAGESSETQNPETPGTGDRRRFAGFCTPDEGENCVTAQQGMMTLTNIIPVEQPPPTATPEPASMALFGAGLLGLFAARRRRAA